MYLRDLEQIDVEALAAAVQLLIRTSERFPTIRSIREQVAERTLRLPDEAEALRQIEGRMRWAREAEDARGDRTSVHPLVADAVAHVGGYHAFRAVEEATVIRGQFLRLYRGMRTAAILDAQTGGRALPAPAVRDTD